MKHIGQIAVALQINCGDLLLIERIIRQMKGQGAIHTEEYRMQLSEYLYNAFGVGARALCITQPQFAFMLENRLLVPDSFFKLLDAQYVKDLGIRVTK